MARSTAILGASKAGTAAGSKVRRRDPAKTRQRLLDAAIRLFSERGYHAVTVDQIVHRARVNKRMLYHYFGNKDGLYVEVLKEVFGRLEAMELSALSQPIPAETAIREILETYFRFLENNPEFPNLLMWENLNRGRFLRQHPQILSKNPVLDRLRLLIAEGQQRGELCNDLSLRHLLVILIGVCLIFHSNKHTLKHTLGLDLGNPQVLETGLQAAQKVILHGLLRGNRTA